MTSHAYRPKETNDITVLKDADWIIVQDSAKNKIPYVYTVGLIHTKQVEIVMADMPGLDAVKLVNRMAFFIQKQEGRIIDGLSFYEKSLENGKPDYDSPNLIIREVDPRFARLRVFHRAARYEVSSGLKSRYFQLYYPDTKGLHPWDSGCTTSIVKTQDLNLPISPKPDPDR